MPNSRHEHTERFQPCPLGRERARSCRNPRRRGHVQTSRSHHRWARPASAAPPRWLSPARATPSWFPVAARRKARRWRPSCAGFGAEAAFIAADVRREDDIRHLVDQTVARFGRIDVAVNNAGTEGKPGPRDRTDAGKLCRDVRHQCAGHAAQPEARIAGNAAAGRGQHRQYLVHHGRARRCESRRSISRASMPSRA